MDTKVVTIEIAKLQLSDGDILVFKVPQFDPVDTSHYLNTLEPILPDGVEVLFLDKDVDIEVCKPAKEGRTRIDRIPDGSKTKQSGATQ